MADHETDIPLCSCWKLHAKDSALYSRTGKYTWRPWHKTNCRRRLAILAKYGVTRDPAHRAPNTPTERQSMRPIPIGQTRHRIRVGHDSRFANNARMRIEYHLSVSTEMLNEGAAPGPNEWFIYFDAPEHTDLDFLRPDVLPPKPKGKA